MFLMLLYLQSFTQYIPLSIFDLQKWMGSPSVYVYDCSRAGLIIQCFKNFATQHDPDVSIVMCFGLEKYILCSDTTVVKYYLSDKIYRDFNNCSYTK